MPSRDGWRGRVRLHAVILLSVTAVMKLVVERFSLNLSAVLIFHFCSYANKNQHYSSSMPKRTCNIIVKIKSLERVY